jgi:hypothetical protein
LGNKPAELHILSLVDHTHPAAAELLDDAVMRDGAAISRESDATLRGEPLGMLSPTEGWILWRQPD